MRVLCIWLVYFFFFFFQAEDGIRDHCVTGVQTCALPISRAWLFSHGNERVGKSQARVTGPPRPGPAPRSEERRVGKSVDLGGRRSIKKKRKEKTRRRRNDKKNRTSQYKRTQRIEARSYQH